jgi:hypothetical protein
MPREATDYVVLDAIADDLESLEIILSRVNHPEFGWQGLHGNVEFTRAEVVAALFRLIRDGLAEACSYSERDRALVNLGPRVLPSGELDEHWFVITPHGRMAHEAWKPAE